MNWDEQKTHYFVIAKINNETKLAIAAHCLKTVIVPNNCVIDVLRSEILYI